MGQTRSDGGGFFTPWTVPDGVAAPVAAAFRALRQIATQLDVSYGFVEEHIPFYTDCSEASGTTELPETPVFIARVDTELRGVKFTPRLALADSYTFTLRRRDQVGARVETVALYDYNAASSGTWTAFRPKSIPLTATARGTVRVPAGYVLTFKMVRDGAAPLGTPIGLLSLLMREMRSV